MGIDISKLKSEFTAHLESKKSEGSSSADKTEKNGKDKGFETNNSKISIFSYADELDKFLEDKYKDYVDSSSIKTDDLNKLKFENGKFVDEEQNTDKNKLPLIGILNDLLNDDKMKCIIDTNNNKTIEQDEIKEFLESIKDLDGSKDDVSIKDLLAGTKKIQELNISDYTDKKTTNPTSKSTAGNKGTSGKVAGGSSGGAPNVRSSSPGSVQKSQPKIETQNVSDTSSKPKTSPKSSAPDELEKMKKEKEKELADAEKAQREVYTGENKNVKIAISNYDKTKNDYEKILKEEQNIKKEQKEQLANADKKVETARNNVNEAELTLKELENNVISQENVVSQAENNLSELEAQLSSCTSHDGDSKEKKSEIEAKKANINSKISEQKSRVQSEKDKLQELKTKKDEAQQNLNQKNNELKQATEERTNLENKYIVENEKVSAELKNSLEQVRVAENNVDNVKNAESEKTSKELEKVQTELRYINKEISEKKRNL